VKTAAIPKTLIWEYKPTEYFRDCLKIQDKITRKVVPLELNKGQKVVQEAVDKQRRAGRPIRILILKYRQGGFSTWAEALLFWFCRFFAGMYMTVSLDIDSATHIFGIADRFYHYLPKSEKVFLPTVASNRKELKFDEPHGGGIIVETAGKSAAGHSYTLAGVHLSEVSRWPEDTDDARAGLMNSIPETPNTIIVVESVANGMSGWFCGEWFKPDSMYEKIFIPWHWQEDYKMGLPTRPDIYEANLTDEERKVVAKYGLTMEQIEWRRYTIHNKHDDNVQKFKEQYPANAEEAFITSGNAFFSPATLEAIVPSGPLRGNLRAVVDSSGVEQLVFSQNPNGLLRLWKKPKSKCEYVIGADVAEGIEIDGAPTSDRHDYSSADVLDRDTGEQVCQLHGKITPDEFGRLLALVGRWYNHAFIGVESNAGYGLHVIDQLQQSEYPQHLIYKQQVMDQASRKMTQKLGWRTTRTNRKTALSNLDTAIRTGELILNSQETKSEVMSFITKPDGRIEHGAGHKDDRVFSLAIANEMLPAAPPRTRRADGTPATPVVLRYRPSVRLLERRF